MSSKEYSERLARAIENTELAEVVNSGFSENRLNVMCRVKEGAEPKWTALLRNLLLATEAESKEAHAWQAHICRHYFLKTVSDEKKLVYGWNISIQSAHMRDSLDFLIRVVKGGEPIRPGVAGEVTEMALQGGGNRNKSRGGKGAFTVGGSEDFHPPITRGGR